MMTIIALQDYTDNQLKAETEKRTKVTRKGEKVEVIDGKIKIGDIYTVKVDRGNQIIEAGLADLVSVDKKAKKQTKKAKSVKKATKKKTTKK